MTLFPYTTLFRSLGEQGMDAGAIQRLGAAMAESHAQEPSIATATVHERESEVAQLMRDSQEHDRERDFGLQAE